MSRPTVGCDADRHNCVVDPLLAVAKTGHAFRVALLIALGCLSNGSLDSALGQQAKPAVPLKSQSGRTELRDMARRAYEHAVGDWQVSVVTEDVCRWSRRWLDQELALASSNEARITAINAHLARMQELAHREYRHVVDLEYYLTEAELMLAEIQPDPKFEAAVAARKALQGTWKVVRAEQKGVKIEPPERDYDTIEITGRRIRFSSDSGTGAWGLMTIDAIAVPHRLDFYGFNEDFGFGGYGIYRLAGDELTLCWTE